MRLVPRVVHTRDHLLDAVLLACDLADDDVVLVVAGDGHDDVGRSRDPRALEHEDLRRISAQNLVLELALEPLEAVAALLDERNLVPETKQASREILADLAAAGDEGVHQCSFSECCRASGSRASSAARTQGAAIAEAMGATEDAVARRVIAGQRPADICWRDTQFTLTSSLVKLVSTSGAPSETTTRSSIRTPPRPLR